MPAERTCPSCNTEKAQRISDVLGEAPPTTKGFGELPTSYHPPKAPWAYLQGFLLGIPVNAAVTLSMVSPQGSESEVAMADLASSVAFLGVWVGYGALKTKNYTQKLNEWKEKIASKFLCRKCSHAFEG
jgi:ribosomal protein L37AE/L43A